VVAAAVDAAVTMVQGAPEALLSRDVATRIIRVADDAHDDATMRVRAIRALRAATGPTVRSWLLQLVSYRSRLLRRLKLAAPSPVAFAAFELLRDQYADHPDVERVVALAQTQWANIQWTARSSANRAAADNTRSQPRQAGNNSWE
jgi:hypothetical protein